MSTSRFTREMADERIGRLIEEARASASPAGPASSRLAATLRRMADRLDPAGARALRDGRRAMG